MSHAVPGSSGRATPRWSVEGQNEGATASRAGLFAASAIVCVGPPLFASDATSGSALMSKPQLVPSSTLWPWGLRLPLGSTVQLLGAPAPVLPETIEFRTVSGGSD